VLSYIWPTFSLLQKNNNDDGKNTINDSVEMMNQWIDFNHYVHQYFWYNDFVKYL